MRTLDNDCSTTDYRSTDVTVLGLVYLHVDKYKQGFPSVKKKKKRIVFNDEERRTIKLKVVCTISYLCLSVISVFLSKYGPPRII